MVLGASCEVCFGNPNTQKDSVSLLISSLIVQETSPGLMWAKENEKETAKNGKHNEEEDRFLSEKLLEAAQTCFLIG